MVFTISKVLWLLLRPSTFMVLLGWVGLVCVWGNRFRVGLVLIAAMLSYLFLILLLPIDQWLLAPLEDRFPRVSQAPAHVNGIIVLGGAVDTELTEAHRIPALNDAAERMTTFVALARRYPEAKLAFAGGNGLLVHGRLSEADVAKALFDQLGLNRPVIYEDKSRTTYENALLLGQRITPRTADIWILITSASHMPRAVGIFRKLGWPVLPWPVAYKTGSPRVDLPGALPGKLGLMDLAAHEWVGLLVYRVLRRIDTVLPGPDEGAPTRHIITLVSPAKK
jgi:uncharacterized SAM-binding protein YcdF (DUF218 family)